MTTDTPTPADQLHAYYQLSDRVVPGGFAWPEEIKYLDTKDGPTGWYYDNEGSDVIMEDKHALAIVERAAEDELRGLCNQMLEIKVLPTGQKSYLIDHGEDRPMYGSLPAALAAENGRGG